jgi:hypothetical protein
MFINKNKKSNWMPAKGSFRTIQENFVNNAGNDVLKSILHEDSDDDHEAKMFALNPGKDKGKVRPELIKMGKDIVMISKKAKGDVDKAQKDIGSYLKRKGFKGDGQNAIWPMKGAQWFQDDEYQGELESGQLADMTVTKSIFIDISTGKVTDNWSPGAYGIYRPSKSEKSGWEM